MIKVIMAHLLVDGYNLLHALEKVRTSSVFFNPRAAQNSLEQKREQLLNWLLRYQSQKNVGMTVVFDSNDRSQNSVEEDRWGAIHIVYTHEALSADNWIEMACRQHPQHYAVISNDLEVLASAKTYHSLAITCEEFIPKLALSLAAADPDPYLEDKDDDGPLYPKVSTKKKGASKRASKRDRGKRQLLKNL